MSERAREAARKLPRVYYTDATDIEDLGWDRVVSGIWETIFLAYRGKAGIRSIGRRWSDLLQLGIGCSQQVADELVRRQVVVRQDRDLMALKDPGRLLAAMDQMLADMGPDLAELDDLRPAERADLIAAHRDLRAFLRDGFLDPADAPEGGAQD
jgi:hypothetical protein